MRRLTLTSDVRPRCGSRRAGHLSSGDHSQHLDADLLPSLFGDSFDALRRFTVEFLVIQFFEDSTLVKDIRSVDTTAPSTARMISPNDPVRL